MTDAELIARQAKTIEEQRDHIKDLHTRINKAHFLLYGCGGPLNDNFLKFNKDQQQLCHSIDDILGEPDRDYGRQEDD